jgi:hypothetical protein
VNAGATQAISDVSIADSGYTGDISVVVSDNTGLIRTTSTSGVSTKGEGSTALTLTGTVLEVNAALASLSYEAGDKAGSEDLWISAAAPGGPQGLGHIVVNTTTAASAVPVVTTPSTATLAPGAARAVQGVSIADSAKSALAVSVSDTTGLLNVSSTGLSVKGEGTNALTLTGSLAAVNAALETLTYTANSSASSDWLWVSANNPGGAQGINHAVVTISAGSATPPVSAAAATAGVTMSAVTSDAALQIAAGLRGNEALIRFAETGGKAGDKVSYSLSGSGATAFSLSSNGILSTAASGVDAGKLYALDVTVKDTTSGVSAAPQALDIVVGSSTQSSLELAKVSGFSAATPVFIYPSSRNDVSVDATGLSAKAVFFAGAGADVFTGGSGVNDYVFGSTTDSMADVIKNFHVSTDIVDFTGLSTKFSFDGVISGATLAADSIGYETSGGNTYVYANTSGAAEALNKTNMRVELLGNLKLTSANFLYN